MIRESHPLLYLEQIFYLSEFDGREKSNFDRVSQSRVTKKNEAYTYKTTSTIKLVNSSTLAVTETENILWYYQ